MERRDHSLEDSEGESNTSGPEEGTKYTARPADQDQTFPCAERLQVPSNVEVT